MSETRHFRSLFLFCLMITLLAPNLGATLVEQMDLDTLCERADKIFSGKVLSATPGTVKVGGGELPTVTYRIEVAESFKGAYSTIDGRTVTEIRMLGSIKNRATEGNIQFHSVLPDLPRLEIGGEYLLLTSAPSAIGLSAPIGLGQGCFTLSHQGDSVLATNAVGNVGLFDGAVSYPQLATQIRSALSK